MDEKISVYGGSGFIGGVFLSLFPEYCIKIPRDQRQPESKNILYLISTTTNSNVFDDLHIDINTNLNVLMEVLKYCKNKEYTINFISSGFVYGLDIIDAKESDIPNPKGFYSITKRTAEQLLISFCETFGCKYRILRLANVYGTDKTVSQKKNALAFLINKLKNNEDIELYFGGKVLRDYMHVKDICAAIKCIIDNAPENDIYNVASGKPYYFRDIIALAINKIPDCKSKIFDIETPEFYQKTQAKNFSLNNNKLNKLGFTPAVSLDIGIEKLCIS